MIFKKKGYVLRPPRKSDEARLADQGNDEAIAKNTLIPHPYTTAEAKKFIAKCQRDRKKKMPTDLVWAVVIEGQLSGMIGLHRISHKHKGEIGYWMGKDYRGGGVMTGVVKTILLYARKELGLVRVEARVFSGNTASERVLEKNEFKKEGFLRKNVFKNGRYYDETLFSRVF